MKMVVGEDKGVSPIIATILLIAITVVLAATLISILSTFTNSTHLENIDASMSLSGSMKGTTNNSYDLNISSTSTSPPLSQIFVTVFNGSKQIYDGSLSPGTHGNLTITSDLKTFSPGGYIKLTLAGKRSKLTEIELIYASSVFATVTPV